MGVNGDVSTHRGKDGAFLLSIDVVLTFLFLSNAERPNMHPEVCSPAKYVIASFGRRGC